MLISALNDYYDILVKQGKALPEGYSKVDISFFISLSPEGKINRIIDVRDDNRLELMPKTPETTIIKSYIPEYRPEYIFGLSYENSLKSFCYTEEKKFADFKEKNLNAIAGIDSPIVNAYRLFIEGWNPEEETDNVFLKEIAKYYKSKFAFCFNGDITTLLHKDPAFVAKCMELIEIETDTSAQCCITGEIEPISKKHNRIKNIKGGKHSEYTLVSFNNDSEVSYGKKQSNNANISVSAMNKYTEVLNFFLASDKHHKEINGINLVYWAHSGNEACCEVTNMLMFEDNSIDDKDLNSIVKDCQDGTLTKEKLDNFSKLDSDTDFYFVGLTTSGSRLVTKFIYRQNFGKMMINIAKHQADIKIRADSKPVPLWRIKNELAHHPKSNNKKTGNDNKSKSNVNSSLMDRLLGAIINGTPYSLDLLYTVIMRIKTDSDDEKNKFVKMNDVRVGLVKACLTRTFNQKEEFKLALDKENLNQAYLCGRLFAILEQIQQKASGDSLNRTIKDAYFSSAAARPASVFPSIMKLSQYHLSKIDKQSSEYFHNSIKEITDKLNNEFPLTLPLTEQGKFIIGYYQQTSYKFKKSKEDE